MKSDLKCSKLEQRNSLADPCALSGLDLWKGTEKLANWGDHPRTQEYKQERMQ